MTQTEHPPPPGLILLSQTAISGIRHAEMTRIAQERYGALPMRSVELDLAEISREAIASEDWSAARRMVEDRFRREIEPLRRESPDYRIVYFGSAPIPLAVQLGTLLGTGATIDVIPRHHREGTWRLRSEHEPPRLRPLQIPDERDRSEGVAIVRVSTSHLVDRLLTRKTIGEEPLVELDVALEEPREDAFSQVDQMRDVAMAFRTALDAIGDRYEGVYRVHLFASVQPGMALFLGAQISAMHPEIQTYQYARNEARGLYHTPALLLNSRERTVCRAPDDTERERASRDRVALNEDIERMSGFAEDRRDAREWLDEVLPGNDYEDARHAFMGSWQHLPTIDATPLCKTRVDIDTAEVADSFSLDSSKYTWLFDDSWLAQLGRRLPDDTQRRCALRLFILHEAVHRGSQSVTRATSRGIGRFPKVLEKVDYEADLWAMLYEWAMTRQRSPTQVHDPARYFMGLIHIATEIMWAFDDHGEALQQIQVRRLNRYLNWYWQLLRLETADGKLGTGHLGLHEVLGILAERPSIELAGPAPRVRDERVFLPLDSASMRTPELAVYHHGKLHRLGHTLAFDIPALLDAVRMRDAKRLLELLRGAAPSILS